MAEPGTWQWNQDELEKIDLDDNDLINRLWAFQKLMSDVMIETDNDDNSFNLGVKLGLRMAGALLLPCRKERQTCDILWRTAHTEGRVCESWYDDMEKHRDGG